MESLSDNSLAVTNKIENTQQWLLISTLARTLWNLDYVNPGSNPVLVLNEPLAGKFIQSTLCSSSFRRKNDRVPGYKEWWIFVYK